MSKPTLDELRTQAIATAKAARENLGEETIQRFAEMMRQKQNSATERAKAEIIASDAQRVAAELLYMIREE